MISFIEKHEFLNLNLFQTIFLYASKSCNLVLLLDILVNTFLDIISTFTPLAIA